jgi:hypothetical protein
MAIPGLKPLAILLALCTSFHGAWAQVDNPQALADELRAQGYGSVQISRTLLGRVLLIARTDGHQREIVIHPVTGEILRDYLRDTTRIATAERESKDSVGIASRPSVGTAGSGDVAVSLDGTGDAPPPSGN